MFSGVFTVPVTGVWRVSFSLWSQLNTDQWNSVFIYHNQEKIRETEHNTYSKRYKAASTGGRELITRAERGDTFHLHAVTMKGNFYKLITCFEFVSL